MLRRHRQRGAAALLVTVMLCFVMVLAVALAQRNVVVEEQRSANDLRASTARAAADAGLDWALARINDPAKIDAACLPSADVAAISFRERMLRIDAASGAVTPSTWNDGGTLAPMQAACVRDAAGWRCSCPAGGRPALPAPDARATAPAFVVELAPSSRAGVVRVVATACTRTIAGATCAAENAAGHEASARVEAAWALLPALRAVPAAALTVRGDVDVGTAALGARNVDGASGGLALHVGGRVVAGTLRIDAPRGSSAASALAAGDDMLRALSGERLFARHFGMGRVAWANQPAARRIACGDDDCTIALAAAIAAGARLLALEGDATLSGPIVLGSPDEPITLVVAGALRLSGAVSIHGAVHAESLDWNDAAPGLAFVRGAVVVNGDVRGDAGAEFERDGAILARLAHASGSFVRVNGSWKDF